jgi:hypothetical protein
MKPNLEISREGRLHVVVADLRLSKQAMAVKFGGLLELAEKMTIVGELGKLLIDEIPLEETPPGFGRAPYGGFEQCSRLVDEASRCVGFVVTSLTCRSVRLPLWLQKSTLFRLEPFTLNQHRCPCRRLKTMATILPARCTVNVVVLSVKTADSATSDRSCLMLQVHLGLMSTSTIMNGNSSVRWTPRERGKKLFGVKMQKPVL